ncbi:NLR family CARD domain-containing protein 3 [Anabarilius grahami]|uniref:NLR family CARD domain-containing protein 3 n=1 Tax=Anabarilius grahami TaxID=495550 RepID=A0A3N0YJL7_ANAGA|nr:NLR family CARD domain-containing protein 3 [Anabarilius grahami]
MFYSNKSQLSSVCYTIKQELKNKFQSFYGGAVVHENPTLLNKIYTELYITEVLGGEVNNQHEIRQIETVFRRAVTEDRPINCNNIFKPLLGQDLPIRTVLTKGIAGVGKTVSVQKFILDWTEGKANQDIHLIFPLPFRELNLLKYKIFSLKDLLQFSMGTKQLEISPNEGKIIFIFDGLDECRLSLDFQNNARLCDVTKSASVDVLLTNLIVGNLLPSALIWITSRPAAADLIPSECVDRVTEVRGFSDPQKEEYFRKRIRDQTLANKIISHLKSSRSLYIMCHIPVFCWISATVLEKMLNGEESGEIPKTLTQMYTHFLTLQINFIRTAELSEMTLVLLGSYCCYKSLTGKTILGRKVFSRRRSEDNLKEKGEVAGRKLTVVYTPGFEKDYLIGNTLEKAKLNILRSVTEQSSGTHAFILVQSVDSSFAEEEKSALEKIMEPLGENVWKHTLVVFAVGDELETLP